MGDHHSERPPSRPAAIPRLHLITPDSADDEVGAITAALLAHGAPLVQVRRKAVGDRSCLTTVEAVLAARRDPTQLVLVDDRVDVALAAGAQGVHLGDDDLPVAAARRVVGDGMVIGATARGPDAARRAEAAGADYLGVGPVYRSTTKTVGLPDPIGLDGLAAVVDAVTIPVVAIAGIEVPQVPDVLATGAHGVAVSAAVYGADDPVAALTALLAALTAAPAIAGGRS